MKVRIESNGSDFKGTRVYVDDMDLTARARTITFVHAAGHPAILSIVLNKHNADGEPYLEDDKTLATEVITFSAALGKSA